MVVSDHGFRLGSERRKEDHFNIETADSDHQPDGIIILSGPDISAGAIVKDADIYDVTPTILYLLDLPVARDLVGHPLTSVVDPAALRAQPVKWVPTYETNERQRASATVRDGNSGEDLERMLRSLGYIAGTESGDESSRDGYTSEQIVNLATVLMGQGRADEAVEKLQGVLKEHPKFFDIRINLAQALYRNNQKAESKAMFSSLISDFPDRLEVYEDYALALRLSGEYDVALGIYDQGLKVLEEWVPGLAGKALCLAHLDRDQEGETLLEKARQIDPRNHLVFWNLGLVKKKQGNLQGAAESLTHALELEPTDASTAVTLAEIHLQGRNIKEAEKILRQTMTKGGDKALLLAELGSLQLRSGDAQGALETLAKAQKLDRNNTDILGNLGMAYAMTGSLPSAIAMFKKLVTVDPEMADAHAQLGAMQAQNGQLNAALASLRKAIELDPARAHAYFGLGRLEMSWGNTDEGRRLSQNSRQLDPSLPSE